MLFTLTYCWIKAIGVWAYSFRMGTGIQCIHYVVIPRLTMHDSARIATVSFRSHGTWSTNMNADKSLFKTVQINVIFNKLNVSSCSV